MSSSSIKITTTTTTTTTIPDQPDNDNDEDDAAMWEGLMPLHVEKIVDSLARTFETRLLSTDRSFTIVQDREGRRRPANANANANENANANANENANENAKASGLTGVSGTANEYDATNNYGTAMTAEGLTENQSTTGAVIWDGAVVAAGILDRAGVMSNGSQSSANAQEFRLGQLNPRGKRVIELGCGCTALPSMTAAVLGAEHVVLTDLEVVVKSEALRNNLASNLRRKELGQVSKLVYRWGSGPLPPPLLQQRGFDLILACDTVYDMALVTPLLDSIEILMRSSGHKDCVALVSYDESIGRKKAYRAFAEQAERRFDTVEQLSEVEKRDDLASDSVTAFRIMHPKTIRP